MNCDTPLDLLATQLEILAKDLRAASRLPINCAELKDFMLQTALAVLQSLSAGNAEEPAVQSSLEERVAALESSVDKLVRWMSESRGEF
uniref:Uncharacterized protein n=1 Tax=viral metagenome TaxID=1070528 RepID=A0A6M3J337_9ZZZZ